MLCTGCFLSAAHWKVSFDAIAAMRALLGTPLAELDERVPLDDRVRAELRQVVPGFIAQVSGKRFKSLALLEFS